MIDPRLIIAGVVLAISFMGGWAVNGWRLGNAQRKAVETAILSERAARDAQVEELRQRLAATDALAAQAAAERNAGQQQVQDLQAAVARLRGKLTNREEVVENGQTVAVVRRSLGYRVCVNAAISGDDVEARRCADENPLTVNAP